MPLRNTFLHLQRQLEEVPECGFMPVPDDAGAEETQSLLLGVLEAIPDAVILVDPFDQIILANRQVQAFFGYGREEIVGRPVSDLVPERFRHVHERHIRRYQDDPYIRPMGLGGDLWGLRKDGTEFPIEIMLSPIQGPDGLFVLAQVRDVTKERWTALKKKQSEERYHGLVETLDDVVYVVHLGQDVMHGEVEFVSPKVTELLGYEAEEFIKDPSLWLTRLHPDDIRAVMERTQWMIENKAPCRRRFRILNKAGTAEVWVEDRVRPILDEQGNVKSFQGIATILPNPATVP